MTHLEAQSELLKMFNDAWVASAGLVMGGSVPVVYWPGEETKSPPAVEFAFAKVSLQHVTGRQATLSNANGVTRFRRTGLLIIQCFVPLSSPDPVGTVTSLGRVALSPFEGKSSPNGIWFRNCRLTEVGPTSDGRYQLNIVVEFTYDELR
jgi:hypothetical protein